MKTKKLILFHIVTLVFLYSSCEAVHDQVDNSSLSVFATPAALALYQTSVYNEFTTQGCASCHGINQGPLFAVSVESSLTMVLAQTLVDTENTAQSGLVTQLQEPGGHNAGNPTTMKAAIDQWVADVNALQPPP